MPGKIKCPECGSKRWEIFTVVTKKVVVRTNYVSVYTPRGDWDEDVDGDSYDQQLVNSLLQRESAVDALEIFADSAYSNDFDIIHKGDVEEILAIECQDCSFKIMDKSDYTGKHMMADPTIEWE